ncbi:hypothetical protein AQAU111925_13250 [Aquirufa aurantiipilula]
MITNLVAVPEPIVTLLDVTAVPVTGLKVNVPVPLVPVKVNADVKLATPFTKSPEDVNLLVPDNPEILPVKLVVTVILLDEALNVVTVLP